MLKFFALALLALHCNCQDVIEVRGDKVIRNEVSHLPLKTVSGLSSIGLSGLRPLSYGSLPVSSYLSSLPSHSYGLNINGLNLGYLNSGLRSNVYGSNVYGAGVNIAPSVYSVAPQQSLLAIRQPAYQHLSVAQPALAIARQQVAIARPQVFSAAVQSDTVRPVSAAIHQVGRTVEYRNVPHSEHAVVPQDIVVEPSDQPINIHFRSRSSTVRLSQEHIAGEPGTIEQTQSQDEPSKVQHEVVKPVIQEVREVIQPYRQVTQEVQPVVENVHRVVSAGEAVRQQYAVEQPLVRQVQAVQAIRQVQPVSYAVAQPAISVAQPIAYAQRAISVAQPAISVAQPIAYAQRAISVAQPYAYAQRAISVAQPIQYQNVAQDYQPIVSSIVREPVIQRIAQPIIGYNRIISNQLPAYGVRQEVRELPQTRQVVREDRQSGSDFIKFAESDDK